jgi:hypothetical protein
MADTIVNTPGQSSNSDASAAGWAVAVIVLLAVIVGGVFFFRRGAAPAPAQPQQPGANVNVTLPSGNALPGTGGQGGQEAQ